MIRYGKTIAAAATGAALLALGAGSAQAQVFGGGAQPYGYGYGGAQCEVKAQQHRALTGVLGAVVGANAGYGGYGGGYGTSAAIGVLGEVMVQGARDKCYREQAAAPYGYGYGAPGYGYGASGYGYEDRGYAPAYGGDPYGRGYGDPYGQQGYGYDYGRGRPGECRYTTASVRLPGGHVQNQRVRICAGADGRFQIR